VRPRPAQQDAAPSSLPDDLYSPTTAPASLSQIFAGKKVYYAHPVTEYGTPVESQIEHSFEALCPGASLTNPNGPEHSQAYKKEGWPYFDRLVKEHDAVVFTCHSNGALGAGVFKEVSALIERGCPALFADPRDNEFLLVDAETFSHFKTLDVPTTRALIEQERALKGTGTDPFSTMQAFAAAVDQSGNLGFLAH
jgi:hypothetical protein